MRRISVVGCGVVGTSWALVFARAGFEVSVYDASKEAAERALASIADRLKAVDGKVGNVRAAAGLEDAVGSADYIQESAPERLEIKCELYQRIDAHLAPETIVGSSTSGFPASAFTESLKNRERCLVAHPINPPHLIPLVELIPAPWTDPKAVNAVRALMLEVGQSPIQLSREINGFVVNRLQSALLGEAFRLVEDGLCSTEDVDKAVRDGLGLRWFFMGPFETIDLNARDGVAEYCRNLGAMYYGLAKEQADPREWALPLVKKVEDERSQVLPRSEVGARQRWRDDRLAEVIEAKRRIFK